MPVPEVVVRADSERRELELERLVEVPWTVAWEKEEVSREVSEAPLESWVAVRCERCDAVALVSVVPVVVFVVVDVALPDAVALLKVEVLERVETVERAVVSES